MSNYHEDQEDEKSLLDHAAEWDEIAKTIYPATDALRNTCKKTAESFRMEHRDGIPRCSCCLLPYDQCARRKR